MHARTSIYHKLILYIFFLGIFVIVAVSLYSFITTRNAIIGRTFNQLTSLRVAKKEQVEKYFNDRLKEVQLFSSKQSAGNINLNLKRIDGKISISFSEDGLSKSFREFFQAGKYYKDIYLIKKQHVEWYCLDSNYTNSLSVSANQLRALEPIIERVKVEKNIFLSEYKGFDPYGKVLFIASPVMNESEHAGEYVIFKLSSQPLNAIMKNQEVEKSLGKSGEVYLVGNDSVMRSESRFFPSSKPNISVVTSSVRNAFQGSEGTLIQNDYRGISTLSSYSRLDINGLNWIILAEIDKKEAMKPVFKLANEIVFLSIFITLFLFVAAYIISLTIARPIIALKNATIRVREGDLEQILNIKSSDELGELTENFNLMTHQLKVQQQELKEREKKLLTSFIDGQEDERQRLSRELHDGLGQLIIATRLKAESMVNSENGITTANISRLRLMFDSLVDEVRSISNNLMPPVLQEFGLELALKQICKEIEGHSTLKVVFDSQINAAAIDKRVAVYVFRIAQEALNNAVKHAEAVEIIITLIGNEKLLTMVIQDDGIGINLDLPCNENGRGLGSMCERVKLLNGVIDISKGENKGTIVSVKIPLL